MIICTLEKESEPFDATVRLMKKMMLVLCVLSAGEQNLHRCYFIARSRVAGC